MTDFGKFTLFPFKDILTSFQSIFIVSQIMFLLKSIYSGVNFSVILNRCMLPAILHNFTGSNTEHLI